MSIKQIRENRGISQVQLSNILAVDRSTIAKWETGMSVPRAGTLAVFAADGGRVENVEIENLEAETRIFAGTWWGKGEGFVLCAKRSSGEIANITLKNCHFTQENPSLIAGENRNIRNVTLSGCTYTHKKSSTHPYYVGKLDLQPNIPWLEPAPFSAADALYIAENGCENLKIKGE